MTKSFSDKQDSKAFINAAQYLAGLTFGQDIWEEAGKVLVKFFGADFAAFGRHHTNGAIEIDHWAFSEGGASARLPENKMIAAVGDVFESSFLTFISIQPDDPAAAAFFPILHENHVTAVMLVGHLSASHLENETLDLYLAVARLIGATYSRKISEMAVIQAKDDWERTFEAVPDSIALLDLEYRIVRANKAMADRLDKTPKECVGLTCYGAVCGASRPPQHCPYSRVLEDGRKCTVEMHDDRLAADYLVTVSPLRGTDGKLVGGVHVAREITERKRAEKELERYRVHLEDLVQERTTALNAANRALTADIAQRKQAEETIREQRMIFETILEQSLAGYWDWDFRNVTEYLSPSFKKMLGYEDNELPNKPETWKKLIFPEDLPVVSDTFHRYVKSHGEIPYNYEVRYRHKNGSTVWVYCAGKVIEWTREGRAARMIGCHLDITEHKKMEEELVKARNLESIGILAGGIAHDFNNLLTGIFGYISLAKQYTPKTSKAYPMLENVELAYNEASSLTNQLIAFSKGGICVEETIQPASLIMGAVSTIMSGSNIKSVFNIADDLWSIHADTRQLVQAIGNIALNARDVMPSGGMLLVSASNAMLQPQDVAGLGAGRYIKISIRDEGCGISPDILPKIFDPYFSTKERGMQKGMGLGLTLSDAIIKQHNGVITVQSESGKGSNLTIYLPTC